MKEANANPDLELIIASIIMDNPDKVKAAMKQENLQNWFLGQVMKETHGGADPNKVKELISGIFWFLKEQGYGE